jgi:preprotein translocase subunit SecA
LCYGFWPESFLDWLRRSRAGRLLPSTTLQNFRHEFLRAKHGIKPVAPSRARNQITYCKLFERFSKLAGMTGTAEDSSHAFWDNYKLSV